MYTLYNDSRVSTHKIFPTNYIHQPDLLLLTWHKNLSAAPKKSLFINSASSPYFNAATSKTEHIIIIIMRAKKECCPKINYTICAVFFS